MSDDTQSAMRTTLDLVHPRHRILARHAAYIGTPHERERVLAKRMATTLQRASGIALAAPQVGHSLRLVVWVDAGIHALCDPIVHPDGNLGTEIEGCLSLPGRWFAVQRHTHVTVVGLDLNGKRQTLETSGLLARMWQHEHDHLEGRLVVDHWPEVQSAT